ncbi:hypothetical protein KFU94_17700 [Chloroflexi bacterium TSY]|nr:hypothetical protein [Chloroflexi bacterium TSY]
MKRQIAVLFVVNSLITLAIVFAYGFMAETAIRSAASIYVSPNEQVATLPQQSVPDELTPIYAIQGDSANSPLQKRRVNTYGIVTAVTQNGLYLQDPEGDGNLATSDGIYIYTRNRPRVTVGDCVEINQGFVTEFYGKTELSELRSGAIQPATFCSTTEIQPLSISFARLRTDPAALFEQAEGMLVALDEIEGIVAGPTKRFRNGDAEIAFIDKDLAPHIQGYRIFQWQDEKKSALMYLTNALGAELPEVGWGDRLTVRGPNEEDAVLAILDSVDPNFRF